MGSVIYFLANQRFSIRFEMKNFSLYTVLQLQGQQPSLPSLENPPQTDPSDDTNAVMVVVL